MPLSLPSTPLHQRRHRTPDQLPATPPITQHLHTQLEPYMQTKCFLLTNYPSVLHPPYQSTHHYPPHVTIQTHNDRPVRPCNPKYKSIQTYTSLYPTRTNTTSTAHMTTNLAWRPHHFPPSVLELCQYETSTHHRGCF